MLYVCFWHSKDQWFNPAFNEFLIITYLESPRLSIDWFPMRLKKSWGYLNKLMITVHPVQE